MDQGTHVAAHGSLREILRAIELDDDDQLLLPGLDPEDRSAIQPSTGTALVCRYERLPASEGMAVNDTSSFQSTAHETRWRDRIFGDRRVGSGIAVAGSLSALLIAGSLFLLPAPEAEWARATLDDLWLEAARSQMAFASEISAATGAPAATTPAESAESNGGIKAFAALGQRILSSSAHEVPGVPTAYTLAVRKTVEAHPGGIVDLPFDVNGADRAPAGTVLIVRGVPENAALTAAEPLGDGTWAVSLEKVRNVKLTTYAVPAGEDRKLIAELHSAGGEVLARASTRMMFAEPPSLTPAIAAAEPPRASGQQRTSAPASVSQWASQATSPQTSQAGAAYGAESGQTEAVAHSDASSQETPDWLQNGGRSALGGPR